jgi:hypothetical protein
MRKQPEHRFQCEVLDYLDAFGRREFDWFAIPNGDKRHPRVAMRLKAEGVMPGVADICIRLDRGRSCWLELKSKKGRLSDEQIGFGVRSKMLGHQWACVKTLEEAIDVLLDWGVLRPGSVARNATA